MSALLGAGDVMGTKLGEDVGPSSSEVTEVELGEAIRAKQGKGTGKLSEVIWVK